METISLLNCSWEILLAWLNSFVDIEASARQFGAFQRARVVRSAQDLLRLVLIHGPGGHSLAGTGSLLAAADLMTISKPALYKRLRSAGDWLEYLLQQVLALKYGCAAPEPGEGLDFALVDGSVICRPGSKGSDWRLHAQYDPAKGSFTDLVLTTGRVAERADRTLIRPGQTLIMDRGYARVADVSSILSKQAEFIVRIGWRCLRLFDEKHEAVDVIGRLPQTDQPSDRVVYLDGIAQPLRLVIQRLPPDKAKAKRKKVAQRANRSGNKIDPRTLEAAGYVILLTSHSAQAQSAEKIAAAYRNRWQIELGFKRNKSLGGLGDLRAKDPGLARTWLLAQLLAAVLTDELANEIIGVAPQPAASCEAKSAPGVLIDQETEPLIEVFPAETAEIETSSTVIALIEPAQDDILLTNESPEPLRSSPEEETLPLIAQSEPALNEVIKTDLSECSTPKINTASAAKKPKKSAAQQGKPQISLWRVWHLARHMLVDAILPKIVGLDQKQLEKVRKTLSDPPRKRVNQANALRPALS